MCSASPDGLVDKDGQVEIKNPMSHTHLETLITKKVPGDYVTQMQWQMACTGRKWCDFVSYDSRMPEHLRLFVKRVERDDEYITELEKEVLKFLTELDKKVNQLKEI
jgi:predicted phage-related endonuclease